MAYCKASLKNWYAPWLCLNTVSITFFICVLEKEYKRTFDLIYIETLFFGKLYICKECLGKQYFTVLQKYSVCSLKNILRVTIVVGHSTAHV